MTIMTVIHQGRVYASKNDDTQTPKEVAEALYPHIAEMNKLHFETDDGSQVLIPGTALQESIIIISSPPNTGEKHG